MIPSISILHSPQYRYHRQHKGEGQQQQRGQYDQQQHQAIHFTNPAAGIVQSSRIAAAPDRHGVRGELCSPCRSLPIAGEANPR